MNRWMNGNIFPGRDTTRGACHMHSANYLTGYTGSAALQTMVKIRGRAAGRNRALCSGSPLERHRISNQGGFWGSRISQTRLASHTDTRGQSAMFVPRQGQPQGLTLQIQSWRVARRYQISGIQVFAGAVHEPPVFSAATRHTTRQSFPGQPLARPVREEGAFPRLSVQQRSPN